MHRPKGSTLAALALYVGLVGWLTWPLAPNAATHLPDTFKVCQVDGLLVAWALAHQSRALTTAPRELPNANIYYPARRTLFYGEAGFGAVPYFLPTFLLTGNPALALNLTFLGCVALTAWALHLLVVRWTGLQLAGFLAAWTFLMTRWILWQWVPCAPNYAVLQYFPGIIFLAAAPTAGLGLAALVVLQGLTSVYVAAAVLVPLGLLALGRCARRATRPAGLRLLAVAAGSALVLAVPYAGYLAVRFDNPDLANQTYWPFALHPTVLPWGLLSRGTPTAVPVAALALIAAGALWRAIGAHADPTARRAWRAGAFWALVGTYISLAPTARWGGWAFPLPHALLAAWFPVYDVVRVPERLGIAGLMGFAVLAGVAFAECARRLPARGGAATTTLALAVAAVMYAEYLFGFGAPAQLVASPDELRRLVPEMPDVIELPTRRLPSSYPIAEAPRPDPRVLSVLRRPGGPLLELPVFGNTSGRTFAGSQVRAMYTSIFHGRRLVNGYSGYWPAGFQERMALALRLPDAEALAELYRETGLELLLVHTGMMGRGRRHAWLKLAERRGRDDLRLLLRSEDDLLFAVTGQPS